MNVLRKLVANILGIARAAGPRAALIYSLRLIRYLPDVLRRRVLTRVDAAMQGDLVYGVQGVRIELDGSFFPGAREMYCRQVYFPTREKMLFSGDTVVDLGCNAGLFTLMSAKAGCRVVSVDAQYGFVRATRLLAERHGVAGQVAAVHALVGAAAGKLTVGTALSEATHFERRPPPSVSMRSLMEANKIEKIDFLKMDIEGSEFALFADDTEWVSSVCQIALELHPRFGDARVIEGALREHGFDVELRDELLRKAGPDHATYLYAHR